ncbi:MAG: hypothetical protein ACI9SP_002497 [Arenicella sp.]|jgi:hypothetical protein
MQIIILGMHRSGTSMLARLINMMGVYFGEDGDAIGTNDENPKGFWERQDVRKLNDKLLHSAGLDWDELSKLTQGCFHQDDVDEFELAASDVIAKLDKHRNWILKEPRLNILLNQWRKILDKPIYIFVYRTPVEVALSLNARNEIPRVVGAALWELYNKEALKYVDMERTVFVSHGQIMADPVKAMDSLFDQLILMGVEGITRLTAAQIFEFVSPKLHRQKQIGDIADHINSKQIGLHELLLTIDNEGQKNHIVEELSIAAKESLEDYELNKKARLELEQRANDFEQRANDFEQHVSDLKLEHESLININNQTLAQIDDILKTSRWLIGGRIVNTINALRGQKGNKPAFLEKVLEIRRRLAVHLQKFEKND